MLFWILVGVTVVVMIWTFYALVIREGEWGFGLFLGLFGSFIIVPLVGFVVCGVVMAAVYHFALVGQPMQHAGQEDRDLRALGTGQDIDGRSYFLGSGYIDQEQVFSYIEQDGDAYRLKQADADVSVVYMDEETDPHVTIHEWEAEYWWFAPFSVSHRHSYEFHIPEGSVADSFEVKP